MNDYTPATAGNARSFSRSSGHSTVFPQKAHYFHKKIGVKPDDFKPDREYLTNQRRRNLPVGESRQGPSGQPGVELAREPGTGLQGAPATGLARHSGNWLLRHGTRKLLQRM